MRRRDFIKVVVGSAITWPLVGRAQEIKKIPTIGVLWHAGSAEEEAVLTERQLPERLVDAGKGADAQKHAR